MAAPPSNGAPLLAESRGDGDNEFQGKRSKRYDPYNTGSKRPRKKVSTQTMSSDSQSATSQSPTSTVGGQAAAVSGAYSVGDAQHPQYPQYPVTYYQQGMYAMPPHIYGSATASQVYPPALPSASPTAAEPSSAGSNAPVTTTSSPPPAPQASGGVTAPGHAPTQVPYASYSSGDAQQNYAYYQSGHYTPYGGMGWPTTYAYAPPQGMSNVPSNGVGKIEEEESHVSMRASAQAPQAVAAEDA